MINHLQDCAKDFRELDRVYIPLDMLAVRGCRRAGDWTDTGLPATIQGALRSGEAALASDRVRARQ